MDTITHCITGAVIARAGFSDRLGKIAIITGAAASLLPDADVVMRIFSKDDMVSFIKYHRGPGNSIIFMIPLALVMALIVNYISKKKAFGQFFLLSILAIAVHTFMDLQTSYGTMLLFPFSIRRFALDYIFIVDFFYSGILCFGLISPLLWKEQGRRLARLALLLIFLYTTLCALNHHQALSYTRQFARRNNLDATSIASLPQPLSPFLWANYVATNEFIYQGFINLWESKHTAPSDTFTGRYKSKFQNVNEVKYRSYIKFPDSPLVKKSLTLEGVKLFLWFARFPIVLSEEIGDNNHIIRLFDLRFHSIEGRYPFLYEIVFDHEGNIESEGFKKS
jgi:inner membrane protein